MPKKNIKVSIEFLKPFSDIVGKGDITVEMPAGTVADLLLQLCRSYPKLRGELLGADNDIGEYVNMFVNDKPLSAFKEGTGKKLANGDRLQIFFPISGG
jgi:MoaD family protein